MGRLSGLRGLGPGLLLCAGLAVLTLHGCASSPQRAGAGAGVYHTVRPGDNVYRIGKRYGVSNDAVVRANRIRDVTEIQVGTRLWIPGAHRAKAPQPPAKRSPGASLDEARRRARSEAKREGRLVFRWPVQGKLTSRFGRRGGKPHEGIDVSAPRGSSIWASEEGKVIHSGRLGAYGVVVIVKHPGHYRSVYAHLNRAFVRKGSFVEKGQKIAEVGSTGNATGPHLHFEIRRGETPRNPMLYLP